MKSSIELSVPDAFQAKEKAMRKKSVKQVHIITCDRVKIYYDSKRITELELVQSITNKKLKKHE